MKPRQLFVTKNDVLRREVEKSFVNMGYAFRRKAPSSSSGYGLTTIADSAASISECTSLFLTAKEWLEILDNKLPGEHFFTTREIEERVEVRNDDDAVKRGVEALFAENKDIGMLNSNEGVRQEMTFATFRTKWRKINSRTKSNLDPALVWLEIKSYIKGSVKALHVDDQDRHLPGKRFLSLQEYLELGRKQSRLDETLRREVYELYEAYESIKRGNYFDEMDVVYNLAGRVALFRSEVMTKCGDQTYTNSLLPIDALFVDEVQDFTQAELYLLTKLSSDPNNLMLAGDTAQSITVGVGFRFTELRQTFYDHFNGIEPTLLQLTHNYRSHSGVLRLAACTVELLYYFFGESLDRLPPDLGLLSGPKPCIMNAESPGELVLMLEGSKRETSRIEFGAHQVVIVRNEQAKQALPDEFDKDWVMTVRARLLPVRRRQ
jgi:UvrD/REP helicase N-terminal domain